jgi:hypothetical protein
MNPEFKKIISDFVADIATVFPEHGEACAAIHSMDTAAVFDHCKRTYAPHFFNILYRNDTVLFAEPVELLPGLNFKALWETPDVSDTTKEAVWKYLQLVMFSVVSDLSDTSTFGDAAKLFEAIDESVLKSKLEEVMEQMQDMFKGAVAPDTAAAASASESEGANEGSANSANEGSANEGSANAPPAPEGAFDPNSMHEHLSGLLGGKIGNLAKEIAEETAAELNLNPDDEASTQSVFQNLFKNPGKLMGIVKSVGQKLDAKLKSGEIKESEIMQEASDLMNKMKKMPGVNNMADLLKKMGGMGGMGDMGDIAKMAASMGLGGKGAKFSMGAMQSHLNQNMKSAQTRERMQQKLEQRKAEAQKAAAAAAAALNLQAKPVVFSTGEKVERTPRFSAAPDAPNAPNVPDANASVDESSASKKKKKNKNRK